jgi:hypothetical protein
MKPLNEHIIKRFQKLAGINEIKVNTPNRGIINIIDEYYGYDTDEIIRTIITGEYNVEDNIPIQINRKYTFITNYISNMGYEDNDLYLEISILESENHPEGSYVNDLGLLKKLCSQYKIPYLPQNENHILLILKPEEYNMLKVNNKMVTSHPNLK